MIKKLSKFRVMGVFLFFCLAGPSSWAVYDWTELNKISSEDKSFLERLESEKPTKLKLGTLGQVQVGKSIFAFSREAIQPSEFLMSFFTVSGWKDSRVSSSVSGKQEIDLSPVLLGWGSHDIVVPAARLFWNS